MAPFPVLLAAFALVVAGCGDDDAAAPDGTSTTTSTSTTSTSSAPSTSSTTSTTGPGLALTQECVNPDGFRISYPESWSTVSDCGQFGPGRIKEPEPNTDERTGVVSAFIDLVPYEDVTRPRPGEVERTEADVAGRRAVRTRVVEDGRGLYPEGTLIVSWMVDAPAEPGTLFVNAVSMLPGVDFDRAVEALDAMVRTVDFTP